MLKICSSFAIILLFTTVVSASDQREALTIEMPDPGVRITIPGIPEIDLAVHPMFEQKPEFRLRGSNGRITVSVVTPEIETEITPMACATAVANVILAQAVVTRDQIFLGRANEETFLIIYGVPLEQSVLLNTHIVSAEENRQCIEAHVSKISTSEADVEPWFTEFGDSRIETM